MKRVIQDIFMAVLMLIILSWLVLEYHAKEIILSDNNR
jgi:hypothetical protein